MKKLLSITALSCISVPMFAQDNYSSPYGTLIFVSLIILAAAILQIILFFKIWGMTNDVAKLKMMKEKDEEISIDFNVEIKTFYVSGDIKSAKELIYRKFFNKINHLAGNDSIVSYKKELSNDLLMIGEKLPVIIDSAFVLGDIEDTFNYTNELKPYSLVKRNSDGILMRVRNKNQDGKYTCVLNGIFEGNYSDEEITKVNLKSN
jgi:hypothetical protein